MDEQENKLYIILNKIGGRITELKMQQLDNSAFQDISLQQFKYIHTIEKLKNPTFTQLANQLNISKPAVTGIINLLKTKKIISKKQSETDKRSFTVRLTKLGSQLSKAYETANIQFAKEVKAKLTEQEFALLVLLLEKTV